MAAVAVMPAIRHIDRTSQEGKRTALILDRRVECRAAESNPRRDVNRPTGERRSVLERKGKDEVLLRGTVVRRCHGIEEDRA